MSRLQRKWMEYWQSLSDKLTKRTKIHLVNATISPAAFSAHHIHLKALEVLSKLTQKKYNAYLVGGCIRDLLLDMTPKDFDVTTNARPEAIKPLFKCARMIGRRFRLVHVVFGRDIIEVSTFRGPPKKNKITSEKATRDQGFLIRDNVYGTIEEDALRRDFTINALYYDHQTHQVIDFSTGLQDIKNRCLKLLGDPATRYREDPVRMLRAARFAAKLDFSLDAKTEEPIKMLAPLLHQIPGTRLFDEMMKLLLYGYGEKSWSYLKYFNLLPNLLSDTIRLSEANPKVESLIILVLQSTDLRVKQNKPVTPAFILSAFFWYHVLQQYHVFKHTKPDDEAWCLAVDMVLRKQCQIFSIPKRYTCFMRDVWSLQVALIHRSDDTIMQIAGHPRFRAAYDFLLLREENGESLDSAGLWWTNYQIKNPIPSVNRFKYRKKSRHIKSKRRM